MKFVTQRMKNRMKVPAGKLKLSEIPEKLWMLWQPLVTKTNEITSSKSLNRN